MGGRDDREIAAIRQWETEHDQQQPGLIWYENRLLALPPAANTRTVYVIGCGSGRELPTLARLFPGARIVGVDPSKAMLTACRHNLARWKLGVDVELIEGTAADACSARRADADLVMALGNVLSLIGDRQERQRTVDVLSALCRPGGHFIGTAYHQWDRMKAAYFGAQMLVTTAAGRGDRGGLHYFTRRELAESLRSAGLRPLQVESVRQLARAEGRPLRKRERNNLTFAAVKPQP